MVSNELFNELYEILKSKGKSKMLIGITGFVGCGKTHFSREFSEFLKEKKINVIPLNMDLYNSSNRAERNEVISSLKNNYDPNWPRKAYPQNSELIKNHLINIKEGKSFSAKNLCDPMTKELKFPIDFRFDKNSASITIGKEQHKFDDGNFWIFCDGVKLPKYKDFFDCLIFLKAENQIRFDRLIKRNSKLSNPANIRKDLFDDLEKNLILDYDLDEKNADIVIDNNNFEEREIIKRL